MNVEGKTIVVTGACSGIGADTARWLRHAGARVIGMDRNDPMLTLDGFVKADLSSPEAIDAAVAGTSPVDLVAKVNYLGLRYLTKAVLPRVPQGGSIVNVSSVLGYFVPQRLDLHKALAEVQGFAAGQAWLAQRPVPQATCYEYFKEALIVWTMQRANPLIRQTGVRMNCVAPGPVFTPILGDFVTQLGAERVQADAARMSERTGSSRRRQGLPCRRLRF